MADRRSFVWVRHAGAMVKVSLAGVEDGADLTKAAYLELGLDKDGVALHRVQILVDGARILPQDAGDRLPSSCSTVEAVVVPVAPAAAGALSRALVETTSDACCLLGAARPFA